MVICPHIVFSLKALYPLFCEIFTLSEWTAQIYDIYINLVCTCVCRTSTFAKQHIQYSIWYANKC